VEFWERYLYLFDFQTSCLSRMTILEAFVLGDLNNLKTQYKAVMTYGYDFSGMTA